jgi:hypothetical protein
MRASKKKIDALEEQMAVARNKRRAEIAERYRKGETQEQIAPDYGISRERVRQILAEAGLYRNDGGAFAKSKQRHESIESARDARYLRKYGMAFCDYKAIPAKAKRAYIEHRRNAGDRGIEWAFSLAGWWRVWQESGKWGQRGPGKGYCMGRIGDIGPYAADNVYICTIGQNFADSYVWRPASARNRVQAKKYEFRGQMLCPRDIAKIIGLRTNTLCSRLSRGWSMERAISTPTIANNSHLRRLKLEQRV